jgi:hypothetical protein
MKGKASLGSPSKSSRGGGESILRCYFDGKINPRKHKISHTADRRIRH